jgi:peroxiredoxin/predicted 2-oxoglutarate/Fe(II)-dependent dioxygenase YbiX
MRELQVGDLAPRLVHPDTRGSVFDLTADHIAGRFWVLVFCPGDGNDADKALEKFARVYAAFEASGAGIVGVCATKSAGDPERRSSLPFPLLLGVDDAIFRAYGVQTATAGLEGRTVTVLLRPNGHVLDILSGDEQAAAVLAILTRSRDTNRVLVNAPHPPVLIVPDVLSRADCQDLISIYENSDVPLVHFTEVRADQDVKTQNPDYGRRDRLDHLLNTQGVRESLSRKLLRRLLPDIKKAFQYEVKAFEGFRLARYQGERQGKPHGHRDNSKPEGAYRRFAMSMNLNSEEFSGGELRFPEYGPQLYKPDTGAAIVFSCSILHEALAVTEGRRFVLITFLFSER